MKNSALNTRNRVVGLVIGIFLSWALLASPGHAATDNYFGTSGTISGSVWSTTNGGSPPGTYNQPFNTTGGGIANFNNTATATGATLATANAFAGINANSTVTWTAGGTFTNFSDGVIPISVASGITLDFGAQTFTGSTTAGYIKNGSGVLALSGNTYGGGFTLNSGTIILRGVNAMGGGAGNTLTINGGIIAANLDRTLSGKFAGGITVGGDFQLGADTGLALTTASLTFNNNVALGSATRTIAIGGSGTYSFNGIISGSSATTGLTVTGGGGGLLALGGANNYTGTTTLSGGVTELTVTTALPGGIGSSGGTSALTLNGGVLGLGAGATFARGLGTGVTQVQFMGSGGFAAYGGARAVNLGGTSGALTWGSGNFVPAGSSLILGADSADNTVDFQNPINLSGAVRTVQVDNGTHLTDAKLTGVLSGSGSSGLTKTGAGALLLNQTSVNTYSGNTSVNKGTLVVDLGGLTTPTNLINSGSALEMGGGSLNITQKNATISSQTFNGTTLNIGSSEIIGTNVGTNPTNTLTVALGSLNRNPGGTVSFTLPTLTNSKITTTASVSNGILGGFAFIPSSTAGDSNWATASGGTISALGTYDSTNTFPANANVLVQSTPVTMTSASINSLKILTSAGTTPPQPPNITLTNSGTSVIGSGGIMAVTTRGNNSPNTVTINGGTLTSGNGADLIINLYNQSAGRTIAMTISSILADNGGTAIGLTKTGDGALTLTGANTFTGDTVINNNADVNNSTAISTIILGNTLALQNSVLNYDNFGGALSFGTLTSATIGGLKGSQGLALTNTTPAAVALSIGNSNTPGNNPTYAGVLSGVGSTLTKIGTNTQALTGVNTYTGATTISSGTLIVGVAGVGSLTSAVNVIAGTLGGSGSTTGAVTIGNGSGGSDSFIAPGNSPGTFSTSSTLSMLLDATYSFELNSGSLLADKIVANGVSINAAVFAISDLGSSVLLPGTSFVAIDNLSGGAISGTLFSNLPQGGTITAGFNTFQANYFGGNGNDLVLSVVPEPGSLALAVLGFTALVTMVRRRRVR